MNRVKRKQPTRLKPRKTITLQLREDEESDLIAWLEDIPDGQRQGVIRDALRAHMGKVGSNARQATRADLAALWDAVAGRFDALAEPQPAGVSGDAIRGIAAALAALDSKISRLASGTLPASEPQPDPLEATPRLSQDEVARRAERMKKSKQW